MGENGDHSSAASLTLDESQGSSRQPPSAASPWGSLRATASKPQLQSRATTAVSLADIHQEPHDDAYSSSNSRTSSRKPSFAGLPKRFARDNSDNDDTASIRSVKASLPPGTGDLESLLGDMLESKGQMLSQAIEGEDDTGPEPLQGGYDASDLTDAFDTEFNPLPTPDGDAYDGARVAEAWKAKLKQYLIFSSAGKPIYSRHGDDAIISGTIGVIQTIISFYQADNDSLQTLVANDARFVVLSKGHMHLVAISRLGETELQMRAQLEALYMQILSTLTLPMMEKMFIKRPSTDLRRPLAGTEVLISSLADGFTKGSPSTLLSALECLRIRKAHRQVINNSLVKSRSPQLLYGLIVAGGRLAGVIRPKKHSLHPGDLQLIFNMLFEADSVRAGGDESWIPICLPGFNNTGFLHMYVSFLDLELRAGTEPNHIDKNNEVAIVLISAKGDAFEELRGMRDGLVEQLKANGSLGHIQRAVVEGRSSCDTILKMSGISKSPVRHFLFKSRANVQFVMPSSAPLFSSDVSWRRLMSVYARLQGDLHGRTTHSKVTHIVTGSVSALAWTTPSFEIYVIAGPGASKAALATGAVGIVQWASTQAERIFVVGGAVSSLSDSVPA